MKGLIPMNPMKTFDPEKPCQVHDCLNDQLLDWKPQWAGLYQEYAVLHDEGVIAWDGFLLNGWTEAQPGGGEITSRAELIRAERRLLALL